MDALEISWTMFSQPAPLGTALMIFMQLLGKPFLNGLRWIAVNLAFWISKAVASKWPFLEITPTKPEKDWTAKGLVYNVGVFLVGLRVTTLFITADYPFIQAIWTAVLGAAIAVGEYELGKNGLEYGVQMYLKRNLAQQK